MTVYIVVSCLKWVLYIASVIIWIKYWKGRVDDMISGNNYMREICHSNTAFMQHCRMWMHQGVLSQRISPAGMWVDDRRCHQQWRLVLPQETSLICRIAGMCMACIAKQPTVGGAATKSPLAGCFHCLLGFHLL